MKVKHRNQETVVKWRVAPRRTSHTAKMIKLFTDDPENCEVTKSIEDKSYSEHKLKCWQEQIEK